MQLQSNPSQADSLQQIIRLLGKVLGNVIHRNNGENMFKRIEQLRRTAVGLRRQPAPHNYDELTNAFADLNPTEAQTVARAFTYFLHLANIAEDHMLSLAWAKAKKLAAPSTSLEYALNHALKEHQPEELVKFLDHSTIMPVLTAHPTEVQRQSTLALHRAIAASLQKATLVQPKNAQNKDESNHAQAKLPQTELAKLQGLITTLWQTRLLRPHTLMLEDEIDNALAYYPLTFFKVIPELYLDTYRLLFKHSQSNQTINGLNEEQSPLLAPKNLNKQPLFLRMGSWIGGDRDGNPKVNDHTLEKAAQRQGQCALDF